MLKFPLNIGKPEMEGVLCEFDEELHVPSLENFFVVSDMTIPPRRSARVAAAGRLLA